MPVTHPSRVRLALAAGAALVLCACGSGAPAEPGQAATGPVRIVSGQEAQNGTVLRSIVDTFNGTGPAAPIELELDNGSDAETAQKVIAQAQAGDAPDAVRVTSSTFRTFVDAGLAQPLDACLAGAPELAGQLDENLLATGRVNGTLYQIPWYVTQPALFYNADLFREAGLDPDAPPATWTEVEAAAARLTDPARHRFGALLYFGNSYNFEGALRSAGGSMVDAGETRPEFASPAGASVFGFWRDLVAKGYMPVYSNFFAEATDAFTRGEVAMYLTSASGYEGLKKAGFDLRLAPMPTPDGAGRQVPLSTNGFVMLTTDPARAEAVCTALRTFLSPESVTATVRATATAPVNHLAATDPRFLATYFADNPDLVAVNEQPSFPWYAFPGTGNAEFQAEYLKAQALALQGQASPQEALDGLASTAQRLLDQR